MRGEGLVIIIYVKRKFESLDSSANIANVCAQICVLNGKITHMQAITIYIFVYSLVKAVTSKLSIKTWSQH